MSPHEKDVQTKMRDLANSYLAMLAHPEFAEQADALKEHAAFLRKHADEMDTPDEVA